MQESLEKAVKIASKLNDGAIKKIIEKIKKYVDFLLLVLANRPSFAKHKRSFIKIQRHLNILTSDDNNFEDLLNLLENEVKFSEKYAKNITEEIEDKFSQDVCTKLIKYLKNRTLDVSKWCNNVYDLSSLFSSAGLDNSPEFIDYLVNKEFATKPAMGRAEILFSLIFKSGSCLSISKNKSASGDVQIDDKIMEVKVDNARLGGNYGYGAGQEVAEFFRQEFRQFGRIDETLLNKDFNFNENRIKGNTNAFIQLCNSFKDKVTLPYCESIMKNAFRKLFTDANAFDTAFKFSNFVESYLKVNENGEYYIDNTNDEFFKAFVAFATKYYMVVENFDYFAVLNETKFIIFDNESLNDPSIIKKFITLKAMPSLGDRAGEQGKKICINLKSEKETVKRRRSVNKNKYI